MLRTLVLLALAALPARSGEIVIRSETTLAEMLDDAAQRQGWLLFRPANDECFEQQIGVGFVFRVRCDGSVDTYNAILAFFECRLTRVGDLLLAAGRDAPRGIARPVPLVRGRHPCAVAGMGGQSVLELAYPLRELRRDTTLLRRALTPRGRDRLLCTLRGLHAGARRKAARALGMLGPADAEIVRRLREACLDEDAGVQREALAALARIRRRR